jgi:hypothetical protein
MFSMIPGNSSFLLFRHSPGKAVLPTPIQPSQTSIHASKHTERRFPLESGVGRAPRRRCCSLFQDALIAGKGMEFRARGQTVTTSHRFSQLQTAPRSVQYSNLRAGKGGGEKRIPI